MIQFTAVKKVFVSLAALALPLTVGLWLLFHTNDFWLDLIGASLPTVGLFLYVMLDHLWTEEQHDETFWLRFMRAIDYFHWKWKGVDLKTKKLQLAASLLVILFISGIAQFCKARQETAAALFTKEQLTNANFIATLSLITETNSQNDIRILETNMESSTRWQRNIYLSLATNSPSSSTLLAALADNPQPALVVTNGSPSLKAWAENEDRADVQENIKKAQSLQATRDEDRAHFPEYRGHWQYVPIALKGTLQQAPELRGQSIDTTMRDLPAEIPCGPDCSFDWGTITLGTNSAWKLRIFVDRAAVIDWDDPPVVRIASNDRYGIPRIFIWWNRKGKICIERINQRGTYATNAPLSEYTNLVDACLFKFLVDVYRASPIDNNSIAPVH